MVIYIPLQTPNECYLVIIIASNTHALQQTQMEEEKSWAERLKVVRRIGNGCQGQVIEVEEEHTGQHYALKTVSMQHELKPKERQRIQFQIQSNLFISTQTNCSQFPKFVSYWFDAQSVNILFQLCDGNSQVSFRKLSSYSQRYNFTMVMLFDTLKALTLLDSLGIIHRDIKPENVLLKEDSFKLGDLGLSRLCQSGSKLTNNIGNKLGRSPQLYSGNYDTKCDVWSLGIHLFYLLENTLPFDENSISRIKSNPNDIEKIVTSDELSIDLCPQGRKTKNILSFLHLIFSEMIVINTQQRSSASYLIQEHFPALVLSNRQNFIRFCLFSYLRERNFEGEYYLIILLAHLDYYRLQGKIKEDTQSNKKKITLKVKLVLFQILKYIYSSSALQPQSTSVRRLFEELILLWQTDIGNQGEDTHAALTNLSEALEIYRYPKVQQKFPLIQHIIRLGKSIELRKKGIRCRKIPLWEIPIDFYKLL